MASSDSEMKVNWMIDVGGPPEYYATRCGREGRLHGGYSSVG